MRSTCAQDNITEEDEAWSRGLPYVSPSVPPSVPDTANASVSCLYPGPILFGFMIRCRGAALSCLLCVLCLPSFDRHSVQQKLAFLILRASSWACEQARILIAT